MKVYTVWVKSFSESPEMLLTEDWVGAPLWFFSEDGAWDWIFEEMDAGDARFVPWDRCVKEMNFHELPESMRSNLFQSI